MKRKKDIERLNSNRPALPDLQQIAAWERYEAEVAAVVKDNVDSDPYTLTVEFDPEFSTGPSWKIIIEFSPYLGGISWDLSFRTSLRLRRWTVAPANTTVDTLIGIARDFARQFADADLKVHVALAKQFGTASFVDHSAGGAA